MPSFVSSFLAQHVFEQCLRAQECQFDVAEQCALNLLQSLRASDPQPDRTRAVDIDIRMTAQMSADVRVPTGYFPKGKVQFLVVVEKFALPTSFPFHSSTALHSLIGIIFIIPTAAVRVQFLL